MINTYTSRFLTSCAAAVVLAAALSACGGGGNSPVTDAASMPGNGDGDGMMSGAEQATVTLDDVPAMHGLAPMDRFTVQPGTSVERGNAEFSCPAMGSACVVSVADDGTVEYERTGGRPSVMLRSPSASEIKTRLDNVLHSSNGEVFSFGGDVAVCQALDCPQADTIYFGHIGDRIYSLDTSGFEFVEHREGVSFAEKVHESNDGYFTTNHRSLGGWLDHSMFLVTVEDMSNGNGLEFTVYDLSFIGFAAGVSPDTPLSGSATWSGAMAGIVLPYFGGFEDSLADLSEGDADFVMGNGGDFISGDVTIAVPALSAGSSPSLNVEISNIVNDNTGDRRSNMSWDGLELVDGAFGYAGNVSVADSYGIPIVGRHEGVAGQVYGQFFGPDHEEIGGLFNRDGIGGAFGARRDE